MSVSSTSHHAVTTLSRTHSVPQSAPLTAETLKLHRFREQVRVSGELGIWLKFVAQGRGSGQGVHWVHVAGMAAKTILREAIDAGLEHG